MFLSTSIIQPPDLGFLLAQQKEGPPLGGHASGASQALRSGPGKRILIVEDEALIAMDMVLALNQAGFEVLDNVDTEADAVDASQRLQPDIILMDITLRQGDGISAARAIMASSAARVIFISGNSDPQTLATVRALGAVAFIRKPFVGGELPKLVADALARVGDR
jgi:two-component system, response regulator PdtaR